MIGRALTYSTDIEPGPAHRREVEALMRPGGRHG